MSMKEIMLIGEQIGVNRVQQTMLKQFPKIESENISKAFLLTLLEEVQLEIKKEIESLK